MAIVEFILRHSKKITFAFIATVLMAVIAIQFSGAGMERDMPANEGAFPSFGTGPVEVRIYASYFCPPCRMLEPEIEPILHELLASGKIRLVLIDMPFPQSIPFIHSFLFALNADQSIENAFKVRGILFDIAANRGGSEEIIDRFEQEQVDVEPFDLMEAFGKFNQMMQEDGVRSTPSAVVYRNGSGERHAGRADILEALKNIE